MRLPALFDAALDRSVFLGYSRIGYAARRGRWADEPAPGSLAGKSVLVTGAGRGLGAAAAVRLAELGAWVHVLVRSADRAAATIDRIQRAVPGAKPRVEVCDVSDLDAVAEFADDFGHRVPALHALIHNAGVMPERRTLTAQGHELALATHVLGPFALTQRLLPSLTAASPGRVIFVSSGGMYAQRTYSEDPEYRAGRYRGITAYARTKRMQVVLADLLGHRLPARDVVVHAMHPGWAETPGVAQSLPGFERLMGPLLRTEAQGADTVVWLAAADRPARSTGGFWHDREPRPAHYVPWTRESERDRELLWQLCVDATRVGGA